MLHKLEDPVLEVTGNVLPKAGVDEGLLKRRCRRLEEDISQDLKAGHRRVEGLVDDVGQAVQGLVFRLFTGSDAVGVSFDALPGKA